VRSKVYEPAALKKFGAELPLRILSGRKDPLAAAFGRHVQEERERRLRIDRQVLADRIGVDRDLITFLEQGYLAEGELTAALCTALESIIRRKYGESGEESQED
jgi:ribosome-binding protein aMBF1 (putative translation factor)